MTIPLLSLVVAESVLQAHWAGVHLEEMPRAPVGRDVSVKKQNPASRARSGWQSHPHART